MEPTVIPSVARDLGGRGRDAHSSRPLPTQVPRCPEDPEATAEAQRTQRPVYRLCVTLRSLRLCGCYSFFSHGGRPPRPGMPTLGMTVGPGLDPFFQFFNFQFLSR